MRTFLFLIAFTLLNISNLFSDEHPNIVVIAVDDMGFSDLGCYGGEIQTPNLDSLAENGLRFTQFYNTARCWPTRCALMTGYYPQQTRSDPPKGRFPEWVRTLPHYIKPSDYRCYHSGKWHVSGAPKILAHGGFDRSYRLDDHDRNFNPKNHQLDDKPLPPIEPDGGYYTTCAITDYSLQFLEEHAEQHGKQPFFLYTAYTVPHFPLHALPEDIEKYRNKYIEGWDVVRNLRHERLKSFGIVNCNLSPREESVGPPYRFEKVPGDLGPGEILFPVAWQTLTDEQKRFQADKMAVHAAMVDRMDREVGRILEQIRKMGAWDNTILFFLSDNGASAEVMIRGDGHDPEAAPGSAASYLCLGPGWSTASNTPFRRHKVWNHEGGISTPLIVHWPQGIKKSGTLRHDLGHVIDLVPTVLDLAGVDSKPSEANGPELPGISLLPAIRGEKPEVVRDSIYFEHEGNAALRVGDWKILYTKTGEPKNHVPVPQSKDTAGWSLYDLSKDRCEQNDLREKEPERLAEMVARWKELHKLFRGQAGQE